jgi:hypothetical protein
VFRRLYWFCIGIGVGLGTSFWLTRFVKQTAARYTPERVSAELTGAIKGIGTDLRQAVAEGRSAMQEREVALRADIERTHT